MARFVRLAVVDRLLVKGHRIALCAALIGLVASLPACESKAEKERKLTEQCKRESTCAKQGLCSGQCDPTCKCAVVSSADCAQSVACTGEGQCTAQKGKCVVASNEDCQKSAVCKTAALCSAKEGRCGVGGDADCKQSDLCKTANKCVFRDGACVDTDYVPALLNPALAKEQAPEVFKVKFTTTKGDFVIEVTRAWAPLAAERLYNLVKINYYKDVAFYRVDSEQAEFGISGKPDVTAAWQENKMRDDPRKQSNDKGYVAFATSGPNTRWAPLVIHLKGDKKLDDVGWVPIGKVVQGLNVVESLNKVEPPPNGKGPDKVKLIGGGNKYLQGAFPDLDYVKSASIQ